MEKCHCLVYIFVYVHKFVLMIIKWYIRLFAMSFASIVNFTLKLCWSVNPPTPPEVSAAFKPATSVAYTFKGPYELARNSSAPPSSIYSDVTPRGENVSLSFSTSQSPALLLYVGSYYREYLALLVNKHGEEDARRLLFWRRARLLSSRTFSLLLFTKGFSLSSFPKFYLWKFIFLIPPYLPFQLITLLVHIFLISCCSPLLCYYFCRTKNVFYDGVLGPL